MSLTLAIDRAEYGKESDPGDETWLFYDDEYAGTDVLVLRATHTPAHVVLQLDDTLPPVQVYLAGPVFRYPVPAGAGRACFSPRSFAGKGHLLYARYATDAEIKMYRNLALNPYDLQSGGAQGTVLFPHAAANVETRGESVFAARNAIDGLVANGGHGEWPYTSWGINRDPEARLEIAFGRPVRVDRAVFFLRADFPHDAWWRSATLRFPDGSSIVAELRKDPGGQTVSFQPRVTDRVVLDTLIKADDPSPFPALTQLRIFGTEAIRF